MSEAFLSAGYVPPEHPYDQALAVATEAWAKWSTQSGAGARRDYVKQHLTVEMLWALVDRWCAHGGSKAARFLLDEAAAAIQREREFAIEGAAKPIKHTGSLDAITAEVRREDDEKDARAAALLAVERKARQATDALANFDAGEPTIALAAAIEHSSQIAGDKAATAEKTRLYSFLIDGRPLADCTAREALAWCERQDRDIEFVRALCHGVPLDDTLGRWYGATPVEVDDIWKRINSEEFTARRQAYRHEFLEAWEEAKRLAAGIGPDGLKRLAEQARGYRMARQGMALRLGDGHLKDWPDPFEGTLAS